MTWHPVHPLLVSGGSEGAILHWDLSSSAEPPSSLTASGPRATLSQAHDSNVWALAFHPLGHLLVSASNDHTTRFWCRERPGDASSVFSGGGEKPPEIVDTAGQEEDEEMVIPGIGVGSGGAPWWGKDEDGQDGQLSGIPGIGYDGGDRFTQPQPPQMESDSFIPGIGDGGGVAGRQNGPLPSQQDMFGQGEGPNDAPDQGSWGRIRARGRWGGGGGGGGGGRGGFGDRGGYGGGPRRGRQGGF